MIRVLQKDDLPRLDKLFTQFASASGREFVPGAFHAAWGRVIDAGLGVVFVAEIGGSILGMLGAVFTEDPFTGKPVALENFWFVSPEARGSVGIRLLNAFEMEAVKRGAEKIVMVCLSSLTEGLGRLYERRGYKLIESSYEKGLV